MKNLRVLIVDDISSMRKFARFSLEKSFPSIMIDEAASGKEAQMRMESAQYDLVICDWEMPDLTGYEVLQWVRAHERFKAVPFIMVTAVSDRELVIKALQAGADGYVVKPYTAELLAQRIVAIIDKFDRRRFERFNARGSTGVHFRDIILNGGLIDVSEGGLFGKFSRRDTVPSIFEKVSIDIVVEGGMTLNGLKGFVIRIEAAEAFIDAEDIKIAIKFLDVDSDMQDQLRRLVYLLKTQKNP